MATESEEEIHNITAKRNVQLELVFISCEAALEIVSVCRCQLAKFNNISGKPRANHRRISDKSWANLRQREQ